MTMQSFRVGLVGAGNISQFHLQALGRIPVAQVVGITDLDAERARAAAARGGAGRAFASLEALCAEGVNVIHVLTPPDSHAELALQALSCGAHVLVEKPAATSVEQCDRLRDAALAAGKSLCVNHSLLYDYFISRALSLVRAGAVGEVLAADYFRSSDYPSYRGGPLPVHYRDGGYPFRDLGVHALYLLQAFLGEIQEVSAHYRSQGGDPNLHFDEWRAMVRCAGGAGNAQLSWNVRPMQNALIVQGTRGVLRADLFAMTLTLRRNTPLPKAIERPFNSWREGMQICVQVPANMVRFVRKKILPYHGVQMLIADFYRTLAAGEPPPVSIEQARPVVEWTERVATRADADKNRFLARFCQVPSAPVLVTGATGFIGRRLVDRLLAGNQRLRVFVRREPPAEWMDDPRVEVILGDLGDPQAVDRAAAGTTIVYHVGAAMKGGAHDFERGSVAGTRHVVDSVLRHGVRRLVYVSSLAVLHAAIARKGQRLTEDWPLEPAPEKRGLYSQAKQAAEAVVTQAVRERGLRAVILRPGRVFGPGATLLSPDVARRFGNRLLVLGNGELPLTLVYVDDVVDAILAAAHMARCDGPVFHLVDPETITQNELVRQFIETCEPGLTVTHLPLLAIKAAALAGEILGRLLHRAAPLTPYRLKSALAPLQFDCSAAAAGLGWRPRIGLRQGLQIAMASTQATGVQTARARQAG